MSVMTAPPPAPAHHSALWRLTVAESRLFLRERVGPIWGIALPMLLLVIFGAIPSFRKPQASFGGYSTLDVYVPILNCLGAMGKEEAVRNMRQRRMAAIENHLKQVPEDARARILLGTDYAYLERPEEALRELNLAVTLRANEASILYNAACLYCKLNRKSDALDALRKSWEAGFRDAVWARRDPDLILLHGDPEFDRLYLEKQASPPVSGSH